MYQNKLRIHPSLLAADFSRIKESLELIENSGAEGVHLDVMDGVFVPPITFGAQMVKAVKSATSLPLDVHLMTVHPDLHLSSFVKAGADYFTFHLEAEVHAHRLVQDIQAQGVKAGIALVPSTPVEAAAALLPFVDLVLIMTVNPGYGGQQLIPEMLEKVKRLVQWRKQEGYSYLISIDGGVQRQTITAARKAGIDWAVAGSAFFGAEKPLEEMAVLQRS